LELLVENPEEDYDNENDVVAPRTSTSKRMSLAFSRIVERPNIVVVYIIACMYSQEYTSIYSGVHIDRIVMDVTGLREAGKHNIIIS
jgi:hypothetical protein